MHVRTLARWLPVAGLLVGAALATWLGLRTAGQNQRDIDEHFDLVARRAAAQIQRRMESYEYGLRGARGAVVAGGGESIDRATFAAYSGTRDYAKEFKGARGFGFIRRVPAAKEADFLRAAQGDGWPEFSVRQLQPQGGERFVIQYIEPVADNVQAIGLDIASEENRRSAAMRALRTGQASITDPITLVQAGGRNQGFLILLPVYRSGASLRTEADRETAGFGWVYAPLVIDEVLRDFDFYNDRVAISLSAVEAPAGTQAIYTSAGFDGSNNPNLRQSLSVNTFGRSWQVDVQARPELLSSLNLSSPWLVFGIVMLLSGGGALATHLLQVANGRAQQLASRAALREADLRYRQLVEGVQDYAIVQLDPEGNVTSWNAGAERIKGYAADEIVGQHISIFNPQEAADHASVQAKLAAAQTTGSFHEEGWRVRKDGSTFWASVTISPTQDDQGRLVGYSKITQDLTVRRQQEQELRTLLALQKAILTHAGVAIIATRMDGVITLFNPSAERLLGYAAEEVVGKRTPLDFHDRGELAHRAEELSRELGTEVKPGLGTLGAQAMRGEVDTREWTYLTKTGQRKPVLLSITAIFDEHRQPMGSLGLAADLTAQKRYEAQLQEAREAADRANQAKSSFLANMSHEIRTPMNAILGMTQLALQGELQPQQRDYLGKAFAASKALLAILNDILDYSKVEAGHLQLEHREMSLETVLSNTASLFVHEAERKGVEVVLDLPADLPARLVGDPLRLGQVLTNLLSNAVKFTARGTITLRLSCQEGAQRTCRARFSVADTGIGMSEAQLAQLFRPFSQADASISRQYGGTGLGLSICARLVALMGGTIEVASAIGKGSEFSFEVDLGKVELSSKATPAPDRLLFEHALVVDDQDAAALVIQTMLHSWGIRAECASNGREALDKVVLADRAGAPYDILLTDWKMPQMDGLALIRELERLVADHGLTHAPKILMVSAYAQEDLPAKIDGLGVAAILSKPVMPSELFNLLRDLRSGERVTAAAMVSGLPGLPGGSHPPVAQQLHGLHVLLVEDNEVNQQVAAAFLQSAGLTVSIACNGRDAVEKVRAHAFAGVLMDLHMPEMDGLEATRIIRAIPACEDLPIVAMTAAVLQDDREACYAAGMNDFVGKPIDPQELIEVLGRWLRPTAVASSAVQLNGHAHTPTPEEWVDHDELDLAGSLARVAGNKALYARLLREFAARASGICAELEGNTAPDLHSLIHRLKGEAANLGFKAVAQQCAAIENELRQLPTQHPERELETLILKVHAAAQHALRAGEILQPHRLAAARRALDATEREQVKKLLNELPALLQTHRMQATRHSQRIIDLLDGTAQHVIYDPVHQLVAQLRFPEAARQLDSLGTQIQDNFEVEEPPGPPTGKTNYDKPTNGPDR